MSSIEGTTPEGAAPEAEEPKSLRRSRSSRWLAGVCGGLGEYFGIHPAVYRVLFVALAFAGGTGILLYAAAALVMPAADREESILAETLRRNRQRPWLVIAMALLALFLIAVLSGPFFFWPGAILVAGAIVLAVWAARGGRGRLVGVLAIFAAVVVLAAAIAHEAAHRAGGFGDKVERPVSASELESQYRLGVGELQVALRDLELPAGETRIEARLGFGELHVRVPADVPVSATGKASWGEVSVLGLDGDGRDISQAVVDPGFADAEKRLVIDARVRGGELTIER